MREEDFWKCNKDLHNFSQIVSIKGVQQTKTSEYKTGAGLKKS